MFARISDGILWDYVQSATSATKDGKVKLAYSKDWETQLFATIPNPWPEIRKLKHPFLSIRAEKTDALGKREWNKWRSMDTLNTFTDMPDVGHLLPFEDPGKLAERILGFLNGRKKRTPSVFER